MDKKEFTGKLKWLEPYRIINNNDDDPLANFFLVLAVVFNDLKGIVFFEKLLEDSYRKPPPEEVSVHAGEYGGYFVQAAKIRISNIQEFFIFLKENKRILDSNEFRAVLLRTNKNIQGRWNDIIDVVFDESTNNSDFINYLILIRNNIGFHYNQSGKNLKKSFYNYFNKKEKIARNDLAYYSVGETMEETRFFYADAAIEEYLRSATGGTLGEGFGLKYREEIGQIIYDMNFTISRLLKEYLRNRPK